MHHRLRVILSFLSMATVFSLAGCGFINVADLTPTVKKTSVLVVGPNTWLKSAQVATRIAESPQGVSVISLGTDGVALSSLLKQIENSTANSVILIQPSAKLMQLPAKHPNTHFYLVGNSTGVTGKNITSLTASDQQLASIAGYIGGGSTARGQSINILPGYTVPSTVKTSVVDAVYSGAHAAFSSNPVQWVNPPVSTTISQGVWVVWGTVPASDLSRLVTANQKLVAVNSNNNLSGTAVLASYSETSLIANGVEAALNAIYHHQSLPSVWNVSVQFQLNTVSSWQHQVGVSNYEQMISTGTLSPTGFLQNVPSVSTAQSLHLPVPPTLNTTTG